MTLLLRLLHFLEVLNLLAEPLCINPVGVVAKKDHDMASLGCIAISVLSLADVGQLEKYLFLHFSGGEALLLAGMAVVILKLRLVPLNVVNQRLAEFQGTILRPQLQKGRIDLLRVH